MSSMTEKAATETAEPRLVRRLKARREEFQQRGRVYRAAWVTAGFTLLVAGLVMLVLPGPALVVIPIALAMLALQFAWAERMLDFALRRAETAKEKAANTSGTQRILGGMATALAIAAFAAWAILYDIPLIPVL